MTRMCNEHGRPPLRRQRNIGECPECWEWVPLDAEHLIVPHPYTSWLIDRVAAACAAEEAA